MTTPLKHPYWTALILGVTVLFSCLYAVSVTNTNQEREQQTAHTASILRDIQTGMIYNAATFQSRCGDATTIEKLKTKDSIVLHYPEPGVAVLLTPRQGKNAAADHFTLTFWSTQDAHIRLMKQDSAIEALQCKA